MIDFKPNDVQLVGIPLAATLGRVEREAAASVIVRACQARGNAWQPVTWKEIADVLRVDRAEKREPFASLVSNPFWRPDVYDLIAQGCARWVGEPDGAVELTRKGLDAIRRWVSATAQAVDGAEAKP